MFERFTDRARRVVVLAQEEARLLGGPRCGLDLEGAVAARKMSVPERSAEGEQEVIVVFCTRCGTTLGAF